MEAATPFPPLAFRRLVRGDEAGLSRLFDAILESGDDAVFHPHPFTRETAEAVCRATDEAHAQATDEFRVAFDPASPGRFLAYGLLRGWSEGYAIPSLGIVVHPAHRGRGVARRFMAHLHEVAAERGAPRVRLKVYRSNEPAIRLYESFGYEFSPHSRTELIGFITCDRRVPTPC